VQCWAPPFKDVKVLECARRRAAKLVTGLEGMCSKEQLRVWSNLEWRRLRGDLLALCSFQSRGSGDRTRGIGSKLHRGGSDWKLQSISLPRGWSNTGTGFLER